MTETVAPAAVKQLASDWQKLYKSAKISGIVGNDEHKARGGYHISRANNPAGNYSIVRPDDKYGPADGATAIDMTMSPADMKTCTTRLIAAYNNANDPRRKYLNAFNGCIDGKTAHRWDIYARKISSASSDHVWHVHLEIRRRYANSPVAMKAILSILRGESVKAYLASIGVTTLAASSTATSVPPFPGILRRNDKQKAADAHVKMIQAQLRKRGWTSQGASDGLFGPRLESTVKKWQASIGLAADGIVGAKTWPTFWTRPLPK